MDRPARQHPVIEPNPPRWEPSDDPIVPGLDTSASPIDQIEQIEQLITIKLQNIDANLSRIQQLMATRLLPAFKRYAVGTEPVREAAKFWTSFFEHAAQVRIPTTDDYTPMYERDTASQDETASEESSQFVANVTPSETSFMPGQAAGSSTPVAPRDAHEPLATQDSSSSSAWIQESLDRIDKGIKGLALDNINEEEETIGPGQSHPPLPTTVDKGKGKERAPPESALRENVLRQKLQPQTSSSKIHRPPPPQSADRSLAPKTPHPRTPQRNNPFVPLNTKPAQWNGIVDLTKPVTPRQPKPLPHREPNLSDDDDDSFQLPPGMSPPVTMDFARPTPRLGRTPKKAAAERIGRDLVGDVGRRAYGGAASVANGSRGTVRTAATTERSSAAPTPPSLTRYTRYGHTEAGRAQLSSDASDVPGGISPPVTLQFPRTLPKFGFTRGAPDHHDTSQSSAAPSQPSLSRYARPQEESMEHPSTNTTLEHMMREVGLLAPGASLQTPDQQQQRYDVLDEETIGPVVHENVDVDSDSSSDSMDEGQTGKPSEAFLMASRRARRESDDSFDQSSDSMSEEGEDGPHPFAAVFAREGQDADYEEEDSFENDFNAAMEAGGSATSTVFGVPPDDDGALAAVLAPGGQLRMMGQELLEDTIGIGRYMAEIGRAEESPTPWGRGG